ncbi:LegC family aminotransferase [Donghicola sp. C2-DW-16]|uniref:LegC family aminotransferase n=1 Tax=Donghicola mangrovi TaxID=2729614 RepID=A0ABX2PBU8_9RHOB|nr:LegC family aminotransferase [Donghicola mangrovi]NVO26951.1 LegC family aminotransferase [Donghicola mangrovi]
MTESISAGSDATVQEIVARVRAVIGQESGFVPLHEPEFHGEEWALVKDCIDSGWVSSVGKYVDQFETEIARISGAKYGVAVVNGTAALEICLKVVGVEREDEVLMPSLTFVATANAASHLGAVPHFIDCSYKTLGLSAEALELRLAQIAELRPEGTFNLETGRRISAIVPMHAFGVPVDIDDILAVAERYNIPVIEDAAESLGSTYKGKPCGGLGRIGAISFNGNKILTTGGGGAIVTNDEALAKRAKHLTTTAKIPHKWAFEHDEIGYNYRMPNINAALGVAQLRQLNVRLEQKQNLFSKYVAAFAGCEAARVFEAPDHTSSNNWLIALILDASEIVSRDAVLTALNDAGYMSRPIWNLLHRQKIYEACPHGDLSVCEDLEKRIINVPSSAKLGANS